MEKISLLSWDIQDNVNTFQVEAGRWELNPKIEKIDLIEKKITVSIDLYSSEAAYLNGASKLKTRTHRIDLSSVDGLQQLLLAEIKKGVEAIQEIDTIDPVSGAKTYKDGFFKPVK